MVTMMTMRNLLSLSRVILSTLADLGRVSKELLTKLTSSSLLASSRLVVELETEVVVEVVVVLIVVAFGDYI